MIPLPLPSIRISVFSLHFKLTEVKLFHLLVEYQPRLKPSSTSHDHCPIFFKLLPRPDLSRFLPVPCWVLPSYYPIPIQLLSRLSQFIFRSSQSQVNIRGLIEARQRQLSTILWHTPSMIPWTTLQMD